MSVRRAVGWLVSTARRAFGAFSTASTIIGIAGLTDDLLTWQGWLAPVLPDFTADPNKWAFLAAGAVISVATLWPELKAAGRWAGVVSPAGTFTLRRPCITHGGVAWQDGGALPTGGIGAVGPLCPRDYSTLRYSEGGVSVAVRDSHVIGEGGGWLVCPDCGRITRRLGKRHWNSSGERSQMIVMARALAADVLAGKRRRP